MLKTGVIGLGQIGGGVAVCLARAGLLAAVYDVRPEAAEGLEGVPGCAASPAEVARQCDVVVVAVVDADQVRGVLKGDNGLLAGARPGMTVVLQSTVSLPDLEDIRALVEGGQGVLVDCGVTGGTRAADKGLVSLVGADQETFERIEPVLEAFSAAVVHMGGAGAGMAAKIARNVIVYSVWRAGHEGALLAEAAGVDVRKLAEAIDISAEAVGGPTTWMTRPAEPGDDEGEKALRHHVLGLLTKDLGAALSLAEDLGVDLPTARLSRESAKEMLKIEE